MENNVASKVIGWTEGDGSGHEGYNVADYFCDEKYLGPDTHGIEPIFEPRRSGARDRIGPIAEGEEIRR